MFTLEESALLRRMLHAVAWAAVSLSAAAVCYFAFR